MDLLFKGESCRKKTYRKVFKPWQRKLRTGWSLSTWRGRETLFKCRLPITALIYPDNTIQTCSQANVHYAQSCVYVWMVSPSVKLNSINASVFVWKTNGVLLTVIFNEFDSRSAAGTKTRTDKKQWMRPGTNGQNQIWHDMKLGWSYFMTLASLWQQIPRLESPYIRVLPLKLQFSLSMKDDNHIHNCAVKRQNSNSQNAHQM